MASSSQAAGRPRNADDDVAPSEIFLPCAAKKFSGKIQSICNGKCEPITMQGLAQA
jgi:hypothetical protein